MVKSSNHVWPLYWLSNPYSLDIPYLFLPWIVLNYILWLVWRKTIIVKYLHLLLQFRIRSKTALKKNWWKNVDLKCFWLPFNCTFFRMLTLYTYKLYGRRFLRFILMIRQKLMAYELVTYRIFGEVEFWVFYIFFLLNLWYYIIPWFFLKLAFSKPIFLHITQNPGLRCPSLPLIYQYHWLLLRLWLRSLG